MNMVCVVGRLVKDPAISISPKTQISVARFTIATDRYAKDKGADFIPIVCFDKSAEIAEKYLSKGRLVEVVGRLQSGSYKNKSGQMVYTLDVMVDKFKMLDKGDKSKGGAEVDEPSNDIPQGFSQLEEDIPFE